MSLAVFTSVLRKAAKRPIASQVFWTVMPFGLQQAIRLALNVVLAYLLAPEMFGIMLIINTIRSGFELLSDVGIGQSVVRSVNANDQSFLDAAWTLQACRGVALTIAGLIASYVLAQTYSHEEIGPIAAVVSVTFFVTGLQSPSIFIAQRELRVAQRGYYDIILAIVNSASTIALALVWPSVWALVWGLVISSVAGTLLSYMFAPRRIPRFTWPRDHIAELLNFGKWIFVSTAIYFAAMSTDRLYFSAVLPLTLVGIYGVARTFSELGVSLAQRVGGFLVFPMVAALRRSSEDMVNRFRRARFFALLAIAVSIGVGMAVSDRIILFLYDARYHQAAFMLPIMLASVWFAVLAAFAECIAFGLDQPKIAAGGNAVKFLVLIVGLPSLVPTFGVFVGLLVLILAEAARWLALSVSMRHNNFAPLRHDLTLSGLVLTLALGSKISLGWLGVVPTLATWWSLGAEVRS